MLHKKFTKYLFKYWRQQALILLLGLASIVFSLLNPYLTKLIIDKAYGNKDLRLFIVLAIFSGCIFVINGTINSLNSYLSNRMEHKVYDEMSKELFRHLMYLPLSFFNSQSTGQHLYLLSNDVYLISRFICNVIPQILGLILRFLFILAVVFYLNWKLAVLATILVPLGFIQPYVLGNWLKEITQRMIEKSQDIFIELHEVFTHINLVKALGRENYEIKRFEGSSLKRLNFEIKREKVSQVSNFSGSILNKLVGGVIALYGGYQVIKGNLTLGSLTAIMIYFTQLLGLIRSFETLYESLVVNSVSGVRLDEVLKIKPQIENTKVSLEHRFERAKIEFKDVYFGYKEDKFILEGINFSIEPRAKIALVGHSGCGKTTLIYLIFRLYDTLKGEILIDGVKIKEIALKSLKGQIGIALQEPFLWDDTIANNILYGNELAGKDEVIKAAHIAQAHRFILDLPHKYDSLIGEMGCRISEGQKQRIAIARAVIKKSKILILDEAMSSLDSETEDRIIENIKYEFKDSSIIVVSHRLSTVKKMELVYFLESPKNIDIGTHTELMSRSRRYQELFASQIEQDILVDGCQT